MSETPRRMMQANLGEPNSGSLHSKVHGENMMCSLEPPCQPVEPPAPVVAEPIAQVAEGKCGVGWKDPDGRYSCENKATHRAVSTNGNILTVFYVCQECAELTRSSVYPANVHGGAVYQTRMLVGDPLWLIYPPLPAPAPSRIITQDEYWRIVAVVGLNFVLSQDPGKTVSQIADAVLAALQIQVAGEPDNVRATSTSAST